MIETSHILCDGKGKMDLEFITIFKIQVPAIVINDFAIKVQTMSFSNFKKKKRGKKKSIHFLFSFRHAIGCTKSLPDCMMGWEPGSVSIWCYHCLAGPIEPGWGCEKFSFTKWILDSFRDSFLAFHSLLQSLNTFRTGL